MVTKHLAGDGAPAALNRLAREQMKTKLLADILVDMQVCELEGADPFEYARELHEDIARIVPCRAVMT